MRSDKIGCVSGMNILELARELEVDSGTLESALKDTAALLRTCRENIRPADKKSLRGITKSLSEVINRVSDAPVRERLLEASFQDPDSPDEDGLAAYIARWDAQTRVDHAIEGARELLSIIEAGEAFKLPQGRKSYYEWEVTIGSLLDFWTEDLGRKLTISGHTDDPRGIKASPTVRFVHQCMELLGEKITEQACRTVLENLRDTKDQRAHLRSW
jgi:hypothetical protein